MNEDAEWLRIMAEALARAVKYDSIEDVDRPEGSRHVIQISQELALDMARRFRLVAGHLDEISRIEISRVREGLATGSMRDGLPLPAIPTPLFPSDPPPPPLARSHPPSTLALKSSRDNEEEI